MCAAEIVAPHPDDTTAGESAQALKRETVPTATTPAADPAAVIRWSAAGATSIIVSEDTTAVIVVVLIVEIILVLVLVLVLVVVAL